MPRDVIKEAFVQGDQLVEEYEGLMERRRANRALLRNFDVGGMLDEQQSVYLNTTLYPPRKREDNNDDE
jgi:hypothetical protein